MYSYAQVANRSYRRGPTPATPALARSGSSASASLFGNVTNTTTRAVVAPASTPTISQPPGTPKSKADAENAPVCVAPKTIAVNKAKSTDVRAFASTQNAAIVDTTSVTTATMRSARPKRKAAVDAPKHWETEKKKTRGPKKAGADAADAPNVPVKKADTTIGSGGDANAYFATPPPTSLPMTTMLRSVRQPAPRKKSKFRDYEMDWSDAPSSTASDAAAPPAEEDQDNVKDTPEEEFVRKRRDMKVRKAAARAGAEQAVPSSSNASGSSSNASGKKSTKRRRSNGNDHQLPPSKKAKGKAKQRTPSPSPERGPIQKGKGKVKTATPIQGSMREEGKRRLVRREATDDEASYGLNCGPPDSESPSSEDSESGESEGEEATQYNVKECAVGVVHEAESESEESDAPRPLNRRRGRAAKRLQREAVYVVDSSESEVGEDHEPATQQLDAVLPPKPEDPTSTAAYPPLSGAGGPLALAPPPALAPVDAMSIIVPADIADPNSIEIVNPARPKLSDQPPVIRAALRIIWRKAGSHILRQGLLIEHDVRMEVVMSLAVETANEMDVPHLAARLQDTSSEYYMGFYRLAADRISTIRGNLRGAMRSAISEYDIPFEREAAKAAIKDLCAEHRYIYVHPEAPHWRSAYMHPAIVEALRCLLYDTVRPSDVPIACYDTGIFTPADDAYGFEHEIPDTVIATAATLLFYSLNCLLRDQDKKLPDITDDLFRRELAFHNRTMQNLRARPRIRHERLSWLFDAVQSRLNAPTAVEGDALMWDD